ncbi:MAG: Pyridoxal phosphate homeostasis protein [Hyphomicrobiaceae bacterium hypho_1]
MDIATRLRDIKSKIKKVALETGRETHDINLVAVSKTFDIPAIIPALEAGQLEFGENRVQEAVRKWSKLREDFSDVVLHLIGPLQSNKVKEAVATFDVIHTIDRPKIARAVASEMQKQSKRTKLFVQINTGEEGQKAGIYPDMAKNFIKMCRIELNLNIAGLMCIPPAQEEPAVHFAFLYKLASEMNLTGLSMGMSADFEAAISLGSTDIRVGSAIFGNRN